MSIAAPRTASGDAQVLSVTQLTGLLKGLVEESFGSVWVAGEISNFARPQSGHCYFTLKDEGAQLRAVMWRGSATRLKADLHDGLQVICRGRLDVYPPRGSYQLVVEQLEMQGVGALELALRQLRDKLTREGLFDRGRKRPLPRFPRRIGVVTSPTGAALRDFLEVLRRRWRGSEVLILPARVQGEGAAGEIAAAIGQAARLRPALDVLVVTRGGGSLEDLWCFNEETTVRAIAASPIPTISAVGHEIDVTLADLAADVRALTPSEAAERVAPSQRDVRELVEGLQGRLQQSLAHLAARLRMRLDAVASRPLFTRPADMINYRATRLDELSTRLRRAGTTQLERRRDRLAATAGKLESLSPLAVLGRGYSVTSDDAGQLIASAAQVAAGHRIQTQLASGRLWSVVENSEVAESDS
ncbi:MAG: exodeoxyribonuclease VII large subunit [Planctomycetales bacterium]|nr:exodeoxyribonuclease VII large subunit [Planctomycetales bacterium]